MSTIPFISQLRSLWQAITGDTAGAKETQEEFLDAWEHHPGQQISDLADNIPIVGHIKGLVHLALGDTEAFAHSEEAATRTLAVLGAGALTAGTGGAAAPILAGVAAGLAADGVITGIESARHQKYVPEGYLGAISEIGSDWRGGVFDIVALGVGDAVVGADGSMVKGDTKTTKVFRVEGEGIFLTKRGAVQTGANSRIFAGPGGSVIESPNIIKLIVPPEEEEKPVRFKQPAVLCLNIGDASRAETYYAQKLLQYREAAEKLRTEASTSSASRPTTFKFHIKSFRIRTADAEQMMRDVPIDGQPSPDGVRRVDITKTSTSFECPQPVYTPLLERAVPDTYAEVQPGWLLHMPSRLLELMRDHQIAYGHVRTFVIVAAKFGRLSLKANIAQGITDQELARLQHGPVSLSSLSDAGINDVEVRDEPVRRLRQSREVKCGRTVTGDVHHARHMEYLAEFSNGSTFWIPSRNVANDLKEEFWSVMTRAAQDVAEVVSADPAAGTVTVKRPTGGRLEVVRADQLFWQEEETPTKLTDAELDGLLHHAHYGLNFDEFIPCTVTVNTDWGHVEILSKGAAIMKDPAAEKNGEYADCKVDNRSLFFGEQQSWRFGSRTIPFYIANNGASFDIRVTHGADAVQGDDRQGNLVLNVAEERFVSRVTPGNIPLNPSTFNIRPVIATPALLSFETDWGAVEITSSDGTIVQDPTIDQSVYDKVELRAKYIKLDAGVFGKKFVIPFVILTRGGQIDITVTHGRDRATYPDRQGVASALFAQNTYTSPFNPGNIATNPKSWSGCPVNERPLVIPL